MTNMLDSNKALRAASLRQIARSNIQRLRRRENIEANALDLKPSMYNILVALADEKAFLFNSVSRATVLLSSSEKELYNAWESAKRVDATTDPAVGLVDGLLPDGFLVSADDDELEAVKNNYFQVRRNMHSMTLTIAPTMACNFACGYCFQGLDKDLKKIGKGVPDAIYEMVKKHRDSLSDLSVCWYGGEPLMSTTAIYQLSDRLIALSDKTGIEYSASIVTNGYHLTGPTAQQLWARRCSSAQITIDGGRESHDKMRPLISGRGTYDKILENIGSVLDETPMSISIRVNVGRDNLEECQSMLDDFIERGFAARGAISVYFAQIEASTPESGTAFEEGLTKREFNRAVLELTARAQEAGLADITTPPGGILGMCVAAHDNGYVVTANGDIHKCWETAHDGTKRIGTVFEPEKLGGNVNAELWKNWEPFDNPICSSCKILPMCGGMCAHRFIYHGAGDDNSLPCPDWKWNTAEYLFSRAKSLGIVSDAQWLPEQSTALAEQSGERHSPATLKAAQKVVLDRVNTGRERPFDRNFLLKGDGRFFEDAE